MGKSLGVWVEILISLDGSMRGLPVGRSTRGMRQFNSFIESANIMEIPLQIGKFTWSREGGTAARSLLNRFFINSKWDGEFENSRVTRKARTFSDHFPLL